MSEGKKATECMQKTSKLLDGIKYELSASVYTLTEDEFETVFFARDQLDQTLEDVKK